MTASRLQIQTVHVNKHLNETIRLCVLSHCLSETLATIAPICPLELTVFILTLLFANNIFRHGSKMQHRVLQGSLYQEDTTP